MSDLDESIDRMIVMARAMQLDGQYINGGIFHALANEVERLRTELQKPAYPVGNVAGHCVCGSWPGSECLKCPWSPAPSEWIPKDFSNVTTGAHPGECEFSGTCVYGCGATKPALHEPVTDAEIYAARCESAGYYDNDPKEAKHAAFIGSTECKWKLRTGELQMGDTKRAERKQTGLTPYRDKRSSDDSSRGICLDGDSETDPASQVVPALSMKRTVWAEGMLQDDSKGLSKALSRDPNARALVREAVAHQEAGELPPLPEPLEIEWPSLHQHALGCGVEDRNIHDRYEAAEYGWQDGVDRAAGCVPDEIYDAEQMRDYARAALAAERAEVARLRRIAALIGTIYAFGNFKAETFNERELEGLLRENGTFWESIADYEARKLTAPGEKHD